MNEWTCIYNGEVNDYGKFTQEKVTEITGCERDHKRVCSNFPFYLLHNPEKSERKIY